MESNFIINNTKLRKNRDLIPILFGDWDGNVVPDIIYLSSYADIYDVLVRAQIFPSRSIAKKEWRRTGPAIPPGFSDFHKVGKLNHRITIWNPR